MYDMDSTQKLTKNKRGEQLTNAKRMVIISKLIEHLTQGYYTTNELAKKTGLTRATVDRYRTLADDLISKNTLNRNNIRNLQIKRTYEIIERLMNDLSDIEKAYIPKVDGDELNSLNHIDSKIKTKTLIYNQIAKFSQHLALITGLNVETHVNVDHQQLVIIRSNGKKTNNEVIDQEAEIMPELVTISDEQPKNSKQGHTIETIENK